jgi:predicted GNAT superfamily acetyltransferase
MNGTVAPPLALEARAAAEAAARHGDVEITELHEIGELTEAADLFIEVWQTSRTEAPCTPALLRALAHSGNYVAGARTANRMVGASVGFLHPAGGSVGLHSHITGVSAETQGRSVGFALKQHQRAWALARGLQVVSWTFDPLVRRNAFLNLAKLGAEVVEYLPDFYGPMADGINAGDETDRCMVSWPLAHERAVAASRGAATEPDLESLREAGARVLLAEDPAGAPAVTGAGAPSGGSTPGGALLVQVPSDIVAIRAADPQLASRWRRALRGTMGEALDRGLVATGITRSGWYVLERASSPGTGQERR